MTASPRQSSPMPGPFKTVPSRVTLTLVSGGNTVSRCAANTTFGCGEAPGTDADDVARLVDPHVFETQSFEQPLKLFAAYFTALKGGAGISQNLRLLVDKVRLVPLTTASSAVFTAGSSASFAGILRRQTNRAQ